MPYILQKIFRPGYAQSLISVHCPSDFDVGKLTSVPSPLLTLNTTSITYIYSYQKIDLKGVSLIFVSVVVLY